MSRYEIQPLNRFATGSSAIGRPKVFIAIPGIDKYDAHLVLGDCMFFLR